LGNPITSAIVNVQNGLLTGEITFLPGLNFISGENGTLKTKLLQSLKSSANLTFANPGVVCRRQAISPKRNAERRAFQDAFTQLRRDNTKLEGLINERNINDGTFEKYPAVGDLFYVVYEDLCRDGKDQIEHMHQTEDTFNDVVSRIFPQYTLRAEWNLATGNPTIEIVKHGKTHVPLEGLSLGEQEILSLALNINSSRDRFDVFLIDEPEVHLNWHLEEKLFEFFDDYCNKYNRQMIIVTHSRAIFKPRYYPMTQFLYWDPAGIIKIAKDVTPEQRQRIAGDAIEIIQLGTFDKPTVFVEDDRTATVIHELAQALGLDIATSPTGNKSNIRSLFQFSRTNPGWDRCLFLEDGDGEGSPYPNQPNFLHLEKYCLECYLLDIPIAAVVCQKTEQETRQALLRAIISNKDKIFKHNKFLEFLLDHLTAESLTEDRIAKLDASEIIDSFISTTGKDFSDYVRTYVGQAQAVGRLSDALPAPLVEAFKRLAKPPDHV